MKRIISLLLSFVILATAFTVPASAYDYFGLSSSGVVVNDSFYDLLGKLRAGAEEVDLTSTAKFTQQTFTSVVGAKTNVKFVRYELKLKKKDTIKFTINTSKDYISDCTGIFIFNDEHDYFYEDGFARRTRTAGRKYTDSVTLSKGTYYLFIATEKYSKGTVDVTISAPKHKETKPKFTVTAKSGGKAKISWKAVPGATKYKVYKYTGSKFKAIKTTTGTSYTVKNLVKGNKYSYIVSAYVNGKWTTLLPKDVKSINAKK